MDDESTQIVHLPAGTWNTVGIGMRQVPIAPPVTIPPGQAGLVLAVGAELGHYVTQDDGTNELKSVYRLTQDGYRPEFVPEDEQ